MKNSRIGSIDALRGIAAFFIIGNHLCLSPAEDSARMLLHYCNMFVGIFAALSGYFLARSFRDDVSSFEIWKRRAKRILLPYFFWTVVYLMASQLFVVLTGENARIDRLLNLKYMLTAVFLGNSSAHLWFLSGLFYITSIFCLLRRCGQWLFKQSMALWCVSLMLLLVSVLFNGRAAMYEIRLFSFFTMGYAFAVTKGCGVDKRVCRLEMLVGLLVFSLIGHCLFCSIHQFVRDYVVAVILLSFMTCDGFPKMRTNKITDFLGGYSMGIYLVHPLFCAGIGVFIRRCFAQPYTPVAMMVDWILCFLLSVLLVGILKRFAFVKGVVA